jgi:hypothetical protein
MGFLQRLLGNPESAAPTQRKLAAAHASTEQDRAPCATGMSKGADNARTLSRDEAFDLLVKIREM